jgi:hypothetical protein
MIGTIITKQNQVCEHSSRCYANSYGGVSHLGGCPVLAAKVKAREQAQKAAKLERARYLAEAKANLEALETPSYLPNTIDKKLESFGKGMPRF